MMNRLDSVIVSLGLANDLDHARALIIARLVKVSGNIVVHSGRTVSHDADIVLITKPRYVSRGGIKLANAIDSWNLHLEGMIALDIGASTGGFTDCLLQAGVQRVYSLDVGYGQLDYKMRQDERVVSMERVNARYPFILEEKVDLLVLDVSFISVLKLISSCADHLRESGTMVALIKPQFEAQKDLIGKNGVITSTNVHALVLSKVLNSLINSGFRLKGLLPSVIKGHRGNQEFLVWVTKK
jgi:23S rRNA (cytidine1920-2'-O)/16S rRNA (cytidine1409-2'-O)-methyltransferase